MYYLLACFMYTQPCLAGCTSVYISRVACHIWQRCSSANTFVASYAQVTSTMARTHTAFFAAVLMVMLAVAAAEPVLAAGGYWLALYEPCVHK